MIYTNDLKIPTNLTFNQLGYLTERIEMTSVNTNTSASKASLAMFNANKAQVKSSERLSSGKRINGGADDAAGIAVSSKMNAIYMGQKAAIKAATDAVSLLKTQETGIDQLVNIIQRVRRVGCSNVEWHILGCRSKLGSAGIRRTDGSVFNGG